MCNSMCKKIVLKNSEVVFLHGIIFSVTSDDIAAVSQKDLRAGNSNEYSIGSFNYCKMPPCLISVFCGAFRKFVLKFCVHSTHSMLGEHCLLLRHCRCLCTLLCDIWSAQLCESRAR